MIARYILGDDDKQSAIMSSTETLVEDEEKPSTSIDNCIDGGNQDSDEVIEVTEVLDEDQEVKPLNQAENKDYEIIENMEDITQHQILRRDPQVIVIKTVEDYKRLSHISEEIDFNDATEIDFREADSDVEDLLDEALKEEVDVGTKITNDNQTESTLSEQISLMGTTETKEKYLIKEDNAEVKAEIDMLDEDGIDQSNTPSSKKKKGFKGFGKKFKNIIRRSSAPKVDPVRKADISPPIAIDTPKMLGDNANNFIPVQTLVIEEKCHNELDLSTNTGKHDIKPFSS